MGEKSSFKRGNLFPASKLRNVGAPFLQCQQTPGHQNDFLYMQEGAFYPLCPLEQAQERSFFL